MADDISLIDAISQARAEASKVGPQHALWDVIFDAEALLAGKSTLIIWGKGDAATARLIEAINGGRPHKNRP